MSIFGKQNLRNFHTPPFPVSPSHAARPLSMLPGQPLFPGGFHPAIIPWPIQNPSHTLSCLNGFFHVSHSNFIALLYIMSKCSTAIHTSNIPQAQAVMPFWQDKNQRICLLLPKSQRPEELQRPICISPSLQNMK